MQEVVKMSETLFEIDALKKDLDARKKKLNETKAEIEKKLQAVFDEMEVSSFDAPSGKVYQRVTTSAKLTDPIAFRQQAGEELWNVLTSIKSATLNKWFKEKKAEAEANGDLQFEFPGIIYSEIIQLALRRAKQGEKTNDGSK